MNNSNIKTAVFWIFIIMVVVLFWTVVHNTKSRPDAQLSFTNLVNDVNAGKIKSVTITGNDLHGIYKEDNQELHAVIPNNHQSLDDAMLAHGVDIKYNKEAGGGWVSILINVIPFLLLLGVLDFHDAADAERGQQGSQLRQEPRAPAFLAAEEGHLQGCGRSGRGQGRAAGDHRIPA